MLEKTACLGKIPLVSLALEYHVAIGMGAIVMKELHGVSCFPFGMKTGFCCVRRGPGKKQQGIFGNIMLIKFRRINIFVPPSVHKRFADTGRDKDLNLGAGRFHARDQCNRHQN